jgi:hypothetical protein
VKEPSGCGADFAVCIDAQVVADCESDDVVRFFDGEPEELPARQPAHSCLGGGAKSVSATHAFMKMLVELELLVQERAQLQSNDSTAFVLHGFSVSDGAALLARKGELLAHLANTGALHLVYAHLTSLGNIRRLCARLESRHGSAEGV